MDTSIYKRSISNNFIFNSEAYEKVFGEVIFMEAKREILNVDDTPIFKQNRGFLRDGFV
jgi:hypothetical protein